MEPFLRSYSYIQDYYHTIYNIYSKYYPAYPINYYSIDFENSVLDREQLMAGTYEKSGVGQLSGMVWKKIFFLPVYGIEQVTLNHNAGEKGLTLHESEYSSMGFSSQFGLKPSEWDCVHFHQEFMSPEKKYDISPMFIVTNTNPATFGEMTHWQCKLKVAPYKRSDIEKQISSYWMFLNVTQKIHRIDTANLLLKLEKKNKSLSERLEEHFHNTLGVYLQKN